MRADAGNLVAALEAARRCNRGITYLRSGTEARLVSYDDLYHRARRLLGVLQKCGAAVQQELIIHLTNNEAIVDAFWACQLGRMIPVPIAAGTTPAHLFKALNVFLQLKTSILLTTTTQLERLRLTAQSHDLADAFSEKMPQVLLLDQITDADEGHPAISGGPEDIALVQFSSGSTGNPKGVCLTHSNILANIHASTNRARFETDDVFLSWMPLTHDMGMIGFHLVPLVNQLDQIIIPTELFVRRPTLWLQSAAKYGATILSSPNFGYRHALARELPQDLDLSRVRLIFNGAEPISADVARRFMEVCRPLNLSEHAMYPVYGLAEASLAVSFPRPQSAMESLLINRRRLKIGNRIEPVTSGSADAAELVCLGWPLDGTELSVIDDSGETVGDGIVGHLMIRGPNVTSQYYQNPQATRELIEESGWVRTGDVGFLLDSQLYVSGRDKDLIIANGQNLFAHDLERMVAQVVPEVDEGRIALAAIPSTEGGDQIIVFAVHRGDIDSFLTHARSITSALTEYAGIEKALAIPVKRIPKTTSGKIQRQLLAEQYRAGVFESLLAQIRVAGGEHKDSRTQAGNEIEAELLNICNSVITDHPIGLTDNLFDAGTSSLKLAQIHERIDDRWPDKLELTDFFDYPTIGELAAFLDDKTRSP